MAVWVITWALITFISAAVETSGADLRNLLGYASAVFAVADAVPPLAKIAFGSALALIIYAASKTTTALIPVATPIAFGICLMTLPLEYYPSFAFSDYFPGHFLAAVAGSLVPAVSLSKHTGVGDEQRT
ncbi:MAG: hypothetical protein AAF184_23710 [Pseudomonadota bacterium]